ncbi:MAG TPA: hypothetical protein VGK29_27520 [Paludibaculum sp.]
MMDLRSLSTTEIGMLAAIVVVLVASIAIFISMRKRRTAQLRAKFGGAEYARAVEIDGNQRNAEKALQGRAERVEGFHVKTLTPEDRMRYVGTWRDVQVRFMDSPAGAVVEADQLLRSVMSSLGYPVSDFEQRAADLSVGYPLVIANYRKAHEIALRQADGKASTEDLRQAMVHYRTLFEELVGESKTLAANA